MGRQLKILIVNQWFWPDSPPQASMLRSIGRHLIGEGHDITVLTAQPAMNRSTAQKRMPWREKLDGLLVVRCRLFPIGFNASLMMRTLNMFVFMFAVIRHIIFRRRRNSYDIILVSTMPPVLLAATVRLGALFTGASFLYHMMDIYPEAAIINDRISEGFLARCLRNIDRRNCSAAIRVVALSDDMRDTLENRGLSISNVRIINNFQLESFGVQGDLPDSMSKPEGSFRLLFAGNVGGSQGLDMVIAAFSELDDLPKLQLDILGDGAARKSLELQAGKRLGTRILFHGYQPIENATQMIMTADLSLVTLRPEIYRIAYPSKTMSYLAAGSPVLAIVEEKSALARMVRTEGVGYVSPQGDASAIASVIRQAYEDRENNREMRTKALQLATREFTSEAVLPKWTELFEEISREHAIRDKAPLELNP